jgi:hypothetical protein
MTSKFSNESTRLIYNYAFGPTRNLLLGAGLCFAIQNKFYTHLPIIVLFPSIYVGYHTFNNKDDIVVWAKNMKNKLKA